MSVEEAQYVSRRDIVYTIRSRRVDSKRIGSVYDMIAPVVGTPRSRADKARPHHHRQQWQPVMATRCCVTSPDDVRSPAYGNVTGPVSWALLGKTWRRVRSSRPVTRGERLVVKRIWIRKVGRTVHFKFQKEYFISIKSEIKV